MTTISSAASINGAAFLQSIQTTGNWMLDASSAYSSNWMDPSSSGPDAVDLAANAFAAAHVTAITYGSNSAVNKGIAVLQQALNASSSQNVLSATSTALGQTVNVLA
jgi:hypothetical protein